MAKPRTFVISCYALCFMFLLLSNQEITKPVEGLKKCYSEKFRGVCIRPSSCSKVCKTNERARYGECHFDGNGRACFCYF